MKENILIPALKNGYAVGAFNFCNMEVLKAIVAAANETQSPVIAQISKGAIEYAGPEYLKGIVAAARKEAKYPIFFHLDHGDSLDLVKTAIEIGCDSVMIDASSKAYEDNVATTKEVVDYAHSKGVYVEAELGKLSGIEEHVQVDAKDSCYTDPDQALDFVTRTGVDSLAIAIGTSHGAYKFSGDAELKFDILTKIQELLPNTPLVLHGSSSLDQTVVAKYTSLGGNIKGAKGIPEEMLNKASQMHICKINVDTDLRLAYTTAMLEHMKDHPENIDPRKYQNYAIAAVKQTVAGKMGYFGSQNQAK
jgi:fructose-bisphosphate aldolase class II